MFDKLLRAIRKTRNQVTTVEREVAGIKFYIHRLNIEDKILNCKDSGITDTRYSSNNIIVSLTTYGKRINDVCFTIESLMQQTMKANKIILWLDESFEHKMLPTSLIRQVERGLEIKYTKDIKSYKKLIPALKIFPDDVIITVDDDVIYDFDFLEKFIRAHLTDPKSIYAGRIHSMTFDDKGNLKPYLEWDWYTASEPSKHLITGVGGVLYPPHSLYEEVDNEEIFMSLSPSADDVWFTAMAKLKGTDIKKVETRNFKGEDYVSNDAVQDIGLFNVNVGNNGHNDKQIKAVFSKYNVYRLIQ